MCYMANVEGVINDIYARAIGERLLQKKFDRVVSR